jgi:hypothetical protein
MWEQLLWFLRTKNNPLGFEVLLLTLALLILAAALFVIGSWLEGKGNKMRAERIRFFCEKILVPAVFGVLVPYVVS